MLELALYIVSLLYLVEYSVFALGLRRAFTRISESSKELKELPTVSVVVAARNEEENIVACLSALATQDYPPELLEIIAVNDESDDSTLALMDRVSREYEGQITILSTTHESSGVAGKARAIAQGVDQATGEVIILTDADCIPVPTWVRATTRHFSDQVDVVAGFTVVAPGSSFSRLQQLDWLHLQALAAASMAFNSPVGVVGNNMAFRREAYEKIGGYRSVRFSVTEDFALFLALHRAGYGTAYICDHASSVVTQPCADLQGVLRQKHRWGRGGMESTLHGYSILVIAFLMLCALCIAPFVSLAMWGIVWGAKFVADLILLLPVLRELRQLKGLKNFLPFQFYFIAQALVVPLMLLNPNVQWKGRVFATRSKEGAV